MSHATRDKKQIPVSRFQRSLKTIESETLHTNSTATGLSTTGLSPSLVQDSAASSRQVTYHKRLYT